MQEFKTLNLKPSMRLLKMFLFGLIGLFGVITIIGLFIPSSVKVTRGIIVDADSAKVFEQLSDVKNWAQWMPWITTDGGALVQLSPVTNQPGSYFKWKGLNVKGSGTISLTNITQQLIDVKYELKDMNDSEGGFRITPSATNKKQTEVQWFMDYPLKWYPWERFYGIFFNSIMEPAFDKGLESFRSYVEGQVPVAS